MEDKKTETPSEVNYKEELSKAQTELQAKSKELEQAKYTLYKKNKEEKTKIFSEEQEETQAPDIEEIVKEQVSKQVSTIRGEDFIRKHAANEDEIELARFHLENSIKSSGNLETDALNALALANAKRLKKANTEMAAAITAKAQPLSVSQGGSSKENAPEQFSKDLTPEQLAKLRSDGMSDKAIARYIDLKRKQGI